MKRTLTRLVAAAILGAALAFGGLSVGHSAQPATVACGPGSCTGGGGGG